MSKATTVEVCASANEADCEPAKDRTSILRNFAALVSAQTGERLVGLFGAIYIRRVLDVSIIGEVAWTASVVSYLILIVSPGFQTVAKREVARDPKRADEYVSLLLSLQVVLALLAYAVVFAFSHFVPRHAGGHGSQIGVLLLLQALSLWLTPFDISWLFYARERMGRFSAVSLACAAMQVSCLFLLVRHPEHVYRYVLLPLPFRLLLTAFAAYYASARGMLSWRRVRFSLRGSGKLLNASLPIGFSMATVLLYYNFDNVLLGFLRGDRAVGIYSTAYRLMLVPTFLNTATFNAYFPQLARIADAASEARTLSAQVLRNMTWIGCSLAFLGWATGQQAVVWIFGGSYSEAGRVFEWLCLDLVLVFFNMAFNQPLVAWNQQRLALRCTMFGAVVNVILNVALIPSFGSMGAVAATILAEVGVLAATVIVRRQIHPIEWWAPLLSIAPLCLLIGLVVKALMLFAGVPLIAALVFGSAALAFSFLLIDRKVIHLTWARLLRAQA